MERSTARGMRNTTARPFSPTNSKPYEWALVDFSSPQTHEKPGPPLKPSFHATETVRFLSPPRSQHGLAARSATNHAEESPIPAAERYQRRPRKRQHALVIFPRVWRIATQAETVHFVRGEGQSPASPEIKGEATRNSSLRECPMTERVRIGDRSG
jgi:hypothetical protein